MVVRTSSGILARWRLTLRVTQRYRGEGYYQDFRQRSFALQARNSYVMTARRIQNKLMRFYIENFRCWDTEWEIPLPTIKGQRDYELVQRAWSV